MSIVGVSSPYIYNNTRFGPSGKTSYGSPPPQIPGQQQVYTQPYMPAPMPVASPTATALTSALAAPPPAVAAPTSVSGLIPQILGAIPAPPQVSATPSLAASFQQYAPQDVAGKGEDYYTSMRDQLKEALRREYFGPLGTVQQTVSGESAAGRLDSGVGKRIIEEAAIRPFNDSYLNIERQVFQMQAEEEAQLRQFNADQRNQFTGLLGTLSAKDSENEMQRNIANTQIAMDMNKLAVTAAAAERGELGREALAQLESNLRVWEAGVNSYLKQLELAQQYQTDQQKLAIEYLRTPLNDPNMSSGQTSLGESLGSYFRPSSGSGSGGSFGGSGNTLYRK